VITESPEVSIVVVSFNTRELLKQCLESLLKLTASVSCEIIVVDNHSKDHSAEMVAEYFPAIRLIHNPINLGFGAANNAAIKIAKGSYIALVNSDAFLSLDALAKALQHIKEDPSIGLGGARLIGTRGDWQPSARLFPSLLTEFLQLSGLADKYPSSSFFGRYNRTWASPDEACYPDWVPGAFALIPRQVLESVGIFDERFFLYYEEVDLCRRIKAAGYKVAYWPDVIVTHLGGESSKTVQSVTFSPKEAQLLLWRMRSQLLYFRKHHGWLGAFAVSTLETTWHRLRKIKNWSHPVKAEESQMIIQLLSQAWQETKGGTISPPVPWNSKL
jgi:GT2 family glycosyltransferase